MKKAFAFGLMLFALALRSPAQSSESTTNVVDLGSHGKLQLAAPKDWHFTKTQPSPEAPPVILIVSASENVTIRISVFWDGIPGKIPNPTDSQMEEMIAKDSEKRYLSSSREKQVLVEKLQAKDAFAVYVRLTDAQFGMNNPPRGQFRNVTNGMVRIGNLWGVFTLLTNEKDGPSFRRGLSIIESLQKP